MGSEARLKIYTTDDGRREYAVASTSLKLAAALFTAAGLHTTQGYMRNFGAVFRRGDLPEHAEIARNPGVIYESAVTGTEWSICQRFQTPEVRAATHGSSDAQ